MSSEEKEELDGNDFPGAEGGEDQVQLEEGRTSKPGADGHSVEEVDTRTAEEGQPKPTTSTSRGDDVGEESEAVDSQNDTDLGENRSSTSHREGTTPPRRPKPNDSQRTSTPRRTPRSDRDSNAVQNAGELGPGAQRISGTASLDQFQDSALQKSSDKQVGSSSVNRSSLHDYQQSAVNTDKSKSTVSTSLPGAFHVTDSAEGAVIQRSRNVGDANTGRPSPGTRERIQRLEDRVVRKVESDQVGSIPRVEHIPGLRELEDSVLSKGDEKNTSVVNPGVGGSGGTVPTAGSGSQSDQPDSVYLLRSPRDAHASTTLPTSFVPPTRRSPSERARQSPAGQVEPAGQLITPRSQRSLRPPGAEEEEYFGEQLENYRGQLDQLAHDTREKMQAGGQIRLAPGDSSQPFPTVGADANCTIEEPAQDGENVEAGGNDANEDRQPDDGENTIEADVHPVAMSTDMQEDDQNPVSSVAASGRGTDVEVAQESALQAEAVLEAPAIVVDDKKTEERSRTKKYIYLLLAALVVMAGVIAAIVVSLNGGDSEPGPPPTPSPTSAPSQQPTAAPTSKSLVDLIAKLQTAYTDTDQFGEAQYQAASWLDEEGTDPNQEVSELLQRFALASFYFSTRGDEWNQCHRYDETCRKENEVRWLSPDHECSWVSIVCVGDEVVTIHFDANNKLPLKETAYNLQGTLPVEIGFLTKLSILSLKENVIKGTIPDWTALSNLETIHLAMNQLSGSLSEDFLSRSLRLKSIDLHKNALTGELPNLLTMPGLQNVYLQDNNFAGGLLSGLGEASALKTLNIENNLLAGEIVSELFSVVSLERLRLSGNEGLDGSLNSSIGNLTILKELSLGGSQVGGDLPHELYNLTGLKYVDLANGDFSGTLSEDFTRLAMLESLTLNNNRFRGSIPAAFDHLRKLTTLRLHGNDLAGEISEALCDRVGFDIGDLEILTADCEGDSPVFCPDCCACDER